MISHHSINQIQTIQNKALLCIEADQRVEQTYLKHRILPVSKMIHLELCKLGFKLINNMLLTPLIDALKTDHKHSSTEKTHPYETRNKSIPNLPKITNNRYRNSFLFKAVSEYFKLLSDIKQQRNFYSFVRKCKHHLLRD